MSMIRAFWRRHWPLSFQKKEFDKTNTGMATKVTDGFRNGNSYKKTNEVTCPSQVADISQDHVDRIIARQELHRNESDMKMKGHA